MMSSASNSNGEKRSSPLLHGKIEDQEQDGVRYKVISGVWSFGGERPSEHFRLAQIVPPTEGFEGLFGESSFAGSFELEGRSVIEDNVKIAFKQ